MYNVAHEFIIDCVCSDFGITTKELKSPSRRSELVDARQTCAIALRHMGYTLKYTAELLGRKDHSTVIHLLSTRPHNMLTNHSRAMRIVKAYKTIADKGNARYRSNMKAFLERVQQL